MRHFAWARWVCAATLAVLAGCADNAMVLKGQLEGFQQQQLALSRQNQELHGRAGALDRDNQELEKLLAQSQQRGKVLEDQIGVLREQLSGVTSQLARVREEKKASDQKIQALTASMRRQGGVSISPNNSFLETLPAINLPDVHVRRDGDVIRVELPADRLFEYGTNRFSPQATQLITDVAAQLGRTYGGQMIGVEGHTDSDLIRSWQWRNNHQLSVAQALAVHDVLITQTWLRPEQLFVVGHGGNHPVVSNASAAGKQRNRRVELVIYPERSRK